MEVLFPDTLQDFGLLQSRADRNAEPPVLDQKLSLHDVAYHLDEIEKKIGANNSGDAKSHEYRLRTVEEELDAITQEAVTEVGDGLEKNGNTMAAKLGANLEFDGEKKIALKDIVTLNTLVADLLQTNEVRNVSGNGVFTFVLSPEAVATFGNIDGEDIIVKLFGWAGNQNQIVLGDGLITIETTYGTIELKASTLTKVISNLLVQGTEGYNAANEEAALYLGDTNIALKGKWGVGFRMNVAGVTDAFGIDENTGDAAVKGHFNLLTGKGLKVNGNKVVGDRQAAVAVPESVSPTPTASGYGFQTKEDFNTFVGLVEDMRTALADLISKLQTHGLIG